MNSSLSSVAEVVCGLASGSAMGVGVQWHDATRMGCPIVAVSIAVGGEGGLNASLEREGETSRVCEGEGGLNASLERDGETSRV